MNPTGSLHDLLPWFTTGRLRDAEAEAFRAHLEDCATCREDLVWMRKASACVDERGPELFEDHPEPDALVDAVLGEAEEAVRARVQRHLALCATCELEAGWIAGDSVAAAPPVSAVRRGFFARHGAWGWGLAAAALVTLAVLIPFSLQRERAPSGPFRPAFLVPPLMGKASGGNRLELAPGDGGLLLVVEVDVPAPDFPIEVQVERVSGESVYRQSGIDRAHLVQKAYLIVPCARDTCVPGSYVVRLTDARGESTELTFEVVD